MGLPWAFCCLDQGKKKKQGTDSVCLRGLKGGYPVIHTPIYSERQGSQAWSNLRPHVGTYQKTGKNRTPEWLNVYGCSGSRWRMVGCGSGWQGESGVAVGREGAGGKRMGEGCPPSVTTFAFTVLKSPTALLTTTRADLSQTSLDGNPAMFLHVLKSKDQICYCHLQGPLWPGPW